MELLGFVLFFVFGAVAGSLYVRRKYGITKPGPGTTGGGGGSKHE